MLTVAVPGASLVPSSISVHTSRSTRRSPPSSRTAVTTPLRGDGVVLLARAAELAVQLHDPTAAAGEELAQQDVQVRPLEVAHAERAGIPGLLAGGVVHVDGDELVVDRGVAIPGRESGLARERG